MRVLTASSLLLFLLVACDSQITAPEERPAAAASTAETTGESFTGSHLEVLKRTLERLEQIEEGSATYTYIFPTPDGLKTLSLKEFKDYLREEITASKEKKETAGYEE